MNRMLVHANGANKVVTRAGGNRMHGSGGDNSSDSSAWYSTDFSEFANAAAIQSMSWYTGIWQDTVWDTTDGMSLDTTEGYGTSDRCLKTNFPSGAYDTNGRTINMALPTTTTDYWSEFWVKISTSFTSNGSNANNPDYKFIFWALQPGDGRNEIKIGNGGPMNELACVAHAWTDTLFITAANDLNSGIWHRYRVHNKVTGGANGIFSVEFWDGTNAAILLEQTPNIAKTSMDYLIMGINRNKIALVDMWIKWGKVTLYNSDPGWGF